MIISRLRTIKRQHLRSLTAHIERNTLNKWLVNMPLGGNVLDIGGGSSPYALYFKKETRLINLDIELNPNTDVISDAHLLPFATASLDAVVCTNVLEHLRDPQKCINEITLTLKPSGELIIIVPFMFKVHPNPEDHWRFTWQCLEHIFAENYEIIDHKVSGGRLALIWEILGQIRGLELLRVFNPIIARIPLENRDYALSYCYRLRKKP